MIKLAEDTINESDIDRLIEWLKTYPRLTKGPITLELEDKWSKWLGVTNTVFCNSGSSANLLMLWTLVESGRISRDCKVVVPALSWATDLSPVIQLGMTPILCDCNLGDLSADLDHLESIFKKTNPDVFILVSVLGLPPDMDRVIELCDKYDVILLEDTCESMGSTYKGKKLGTFGLMSSFSTYFGHHISTIEGGFVCTNDDELYEVLKSIRSHGWDRDADEWYSKSLRNKWGTSDFDALYTFYNSGFNLRSTDLQAYIGLGQIDKLDEFCQKRNSNFNLYQDILTGSMLDLDLSDRGFVSSMAYPMMSANKSVIIHKLREMEVEVRPLICGSMGTQPFYINRYGSSILPNVSKVDEFGFYVPNHPGMSHSDVKLITEVINECDGLTDPHLQRR